MGTECSHETSQVGISYPEDVLQTRKTTHSLLISESSALAMNSFRAILS